MCLVTISTRRRNIMGEQSGGQPPMPPGEAGRTMVVFAPRVDAALKQQADDLRAITGQTVNEIGQEALQMWVDAQLADEDVRAQAMAGLEEEQRRLEEKRASIARVLGTTAGTSGDATKSRGTGQSRRRTTDKE
jgi:hypothetical protein